MKVPSNIISTNKYTQGNEFIYLDTHKNYQGYYYELNSKYFAGKKFSNVSREIIKVSSEKVNELKLDSKTSTYGNLNNVKLPSIKIPSIIYQGNTLTRYFAKKINYNPVLIKEIDKTTFEKLQKDPLYQVVSLVIPANDDSNSEAIDKADQQMPGLKAFLIG